MSTDLMGALALSILRRAAPAERVHVTESIKRTDMLFFGDRPPAMTNFLYERVH